MPCENLARPPPLLRAFRRQCHSSPPFSAHSSRLPASSRGPRLLVRPQRWQPTRLPRPWDSPGKNIGVGCHFLLQCMKVKSEREVAQLCLTLSDPMDCSPPGSSVHGIFQARVLQWGAIAFSVTLFTCPVVFGVYGVRKARVHGCQ